MHGIRWWVATFALQALIIWMIFIDFDESQIVMRAVTPAELVTVFLAAGFLTLRSRAPWVFLAAVMLIYLYFTVLTPYPLPLIPYLFALACGVYAVASVVRMRTALLMGLGVEVILMTAGVIAKSATIVHVFTLPTTIAVVSAVGIGQLVYSRRQITASANRRADDAELTREAVASARVAELRLATARDLHDRVSHQVAAINLHAASAMRVLPLEAEAARESLDTIQRSAQQILEEIADLLADLRHEREIGSSVSPRLDALAELVTAMASQGLEIDVRVDDRVGSLSEAVSTTAYRIIHEGVVNAYKHGSRDSPTIVRAAMGPETLRIAVRNPIDGRSSDVIASGYGLLGIRERVASHGGVLDAGVRNGRFELAVELPLAPR